LDRYAAVAPDGSYRSPIENPNRRFFTMLGTLVQGRVSVAGAAITAAETAMTIAVRYALRRRQFAAAGGDHHGANRNGDGTGAGERLLLDYPGHRRRLLPLLARTYALHFAQAELTAELDAVLSGPVADPDTWRRDDSADAEHRRRELEARAAGTKALATWHAARTIQQCREACGGAGYMWENRLGALRADTDVFTTFEGDNHVLMQLVGKGLITSYTAGFEDLDPLGTVRFVAGQALAAVMERTSAHQLAQWISDAFRGDERWDTDAGVREKDYQLAMVRWREEHQLTALARRMKHWSDQGLGEDEVFVRVQTHLVGCARVHLERLVMEAFVAAYRRMADGPEKDAVNLVADLHGLATIEADRGWWLEHGRLTAQRSKEISRTVDALCTRLRPIAGDLVDAFGIPDACCAAPMVEG
jgi:acyl-CoA oxidase